MLSFAANQYGDVFLLDKEGKIKVSALKKKFHGTNDEIIYDLSINNSNLFESYKFTNIECNTDGTTLFLWTDKVCMLLPYGSRSILLSCFPFFLSYEQLFVLFVALNFYILTVR